MFNIHTAQVNDQILLEVNCQKVTATIDKIEPHSINWNLFKVYVTTDSPVQVWNETDIRTSFCVSHDITPGMNDRKVTQILA